MAFINYDKKPEIREYGKYELAAACSSLSPTYFWGTYLPENFPDVLVEMRKAGYKDKGMRNINPRIAKILIEAIFGQ